MHRRSGRIALSLNYGLTAGIRLETRLKIAIGRKGHLLCLLKLNIGLFLLGLRTERGSVSIVRIPNRSALNPASYGSGSECHSEGAGNAVFIARSTSGSARGVDYLSIARSSL